MILASEIPPAQLDAMERLVEALPPGDFAEVGVYHGGSAQRLYPIAQRQGRKLHLFDTFTGLPHHIAGLDTMPLRHFADPDAPSIIALLMPAAVLHIGLYPDTHPPDLRDLAFVHCDCDQYQSYIAVIGYMWPILVPGGVLLFDDYPYLAGARKAVDEYFAGMLKQCHERYYVVKE